MHARTELDTLGLDSPNSQCSADNNQLCPPSNITDRVLVGRRAWHMALTPEEDKLYSTHGVSGDVTMVNVATRKAIKTIKVGCYPGGITILPKENIPQ